MAYIDVVFVIFLGLVLGSFSTALSYRVPRGLDWVSDRSACPYCKTYLGFLDLVPIFSWILSNGKCRHCKSPVSIRYPLLEVLSVALCLVVYVVFGLSVEAILFILCVPLMTSLIVIDLKYLILPNILVGGIFFIGIIRLACIFYAQFGFSDGGLIYDYLVGAMLYGGVSWLTGAIMAKLLKRDALGFGDVKFFCVAGLWLGTAPLPYFLMISGFLGVIMALVWRIITKDNVFPFGPALIVAFYILVLVQGRVFM